LRSPAALFRELTTESWRALDEEAAQLREERGPGHFDRKPLIAFGTGAVFLVLMEYWGMPEDFARTVEWLVAQENDGSLSTTFFRSLEGSPYWALMHHAWWALWRVLGFLVLPVIVIWLSGDRVRDQHVTTKHPDPPRLAPFYWVGLAVALVLLAVVSFAPGFQATYPFYRGAGRSISDLLLWELLYAAQFFSLEFFFRGWWLRAGRTMGSHAIWAMMVPYVMIHVGKPMMETLAAIIAGLFLGTLAMRGRSIWPGFALHCAVAVGMDVACLAQRGELPTQWAP
jgi:hypothetical protein